MNLEDNRLLALMGAGSLEAISSAFDFVALRQGQPIHEPMGPITKLYFLTAGMSSEITIDDSGQRIEVGCVGNEGLAGVPAILGVDQSPHRSFMETDGSAFVIGTERLMDPARKNARLMSILLRYVHVS